MANRIQHLRGSDSEHNNFTGAKGEISLVTDTTSNKIPTGELRVHDGSTAGGLQAQGKGIAKVWVNFNGTLDTTGSSLSVNENVFVRDSHNVTSVTFIGTADYEINFANNFSNTNYAVTGMAGYGDNNSNNTGMRVVSISSNGDFNTTMQVSKVRVATLYGNGQVESVKYCSVAIFGS